MKWTATTALFLLTPVLAPAQDTNPSYRGQGYVFFGLGAGTGAPSSAPFEHVGGGVEGFLYKGLAFGGEVDYAHSGKQYAVSPAWIGSVDFSYHLGRHAPRGKIDPFLLGGFSVVGPTPGGSGRGAAGGNFGGGANWWLAEHAALRFEFRDVVGGYPFWPYNHVLSFRVGVTFR